MGAHTLAALHTHSQALLMGRSFFPHLISGPFETGLHETFIFSIVACLIAAGASLLRGGRYLAEGSDAGEEPLPRGETQPERARARAGAASG